MPVTVYDVLKQRIVLLDLAPGSAINSSTLAKELGVSATPIREALIRLEADDLVRRVPNSTPHVTEVHLHNLKDVLEVRLFLVEQIAKLAAQRVTPSEIKAMEALLNRMKGESDRRALIQLDADFHDLVNQATKNSALTKVAELMRNQVMRLWFYVRNEHTYWEDLISNREKLIGALRKGDVGLTADILKGHVLRFVEEVKQAVWS